MTEQELKCSALAVIDDAIETLKAPGGFTQDFYWAITTERPNDDYDVYGSEDLEPATTFCAIGGVEHSLYKLCKADSTIAKSRERYAYLGTDYAAAGDPELTIDKAPTETLRTYGIVMWELNKAAIARGYSSIEGMAEFDTFDEMMEAFADARASLAGAVPA